MAGLRYVLLGYGHPRSAWFRDVAMWANSASIAAEFVKCVTAEEVRARLASGRAHSALLVDAGLPGFDRDLVHAANASGTPVVAVIAGPAAGRPAGTRGAPGGPPARIQGWSPSDLGVAAVLAAGFSRTDLLGVLEAHAPMIGRGDALPPALEDPVRALSPGRLVAVTGPGGSGASTAAMALAQAMAADPRYSRRVLLADLALRADQAMLHDAGEVGPGVQELVEAHRLGRPGAAAIEAATFDVPARGYRLLLGLRQPSGWSALRPRAFDAALEGLRSTFQAVVADVTGDFEGEADGGSVEVEERNHMARATVAAADAVVVVGTPGLKGVHSLAQVLRAALSAGVDPHRLLPAVSRGPRHPRTRAQMAAALAELLADAPVAGLLALPERKVEEAIRDGTPLPAALGGPLVAGVHAVLDRTADALPPTSPLQAITPGSLGRWYGLGDDAPSQ